MSGITSAGSGHLCRHVKYIRPIRYDFPIGISAYRSVISLQSIDLNGKRLLVSELVWWGQLVIGPYRNEPDIFGGQTEQKEGGKELRSAINSK